MTEASYTAWDDKQYVWPPPEGWYEASDGKWWPEGYGPPAEASTEDAAGSSAAESGTDQSDTEQSGADSSTAGDSGAAVAAEIDAGIDAEVDAAVEGTTGAVADAVPGAEAAGVAGAAEAWTESDPAAAAAAAIDDPGGASELAESAFGSVGDAAESAVGGVGDLAGTAGDDISAAAAETRAMDDGAGAFSSAPMEMNDLSSVAGGQLSDLAGDLGDSVEDVGSGLAGSVPDLNDVTEEVSSQLPTAGDLPGLDSVPGADSLPDLGSVPGVDSLPDLGEATGLDQAPKLDEAAAAFPGGELPGIDAQAPAADPIEGSIEQLDAAYEGISNAATDLGENVTQVVPTDISAAPVDFVPPSGPGGGFGEPPTAQPLSPLDRPTGQAPDPANPIFDQNVGGVAPPQFGAAPGGPPQGGAPPPADQFALPPAPDFGPPPGQQQAGFGAQPPVAPQGYTGALGADPGIDSQAILGQKAKDGRSKAPILALLGVLVLAAIGFGLYYAFGRGSDSNNDADVASVGPGSVDQPHPRATGVVVFYPDGDTDQRWVVEVLEPVRDATADITGADAVAAPEAGEVFAATRIRVRNESGVDGASLDDLDFNAVNAAGDLIVRDDNQCSFSAGDIDYSASVAIGTEVEGTVCWAVPVADLNGLKLGIESDKVAGRVHIALQ